jgi:hypothetical protein
MLSIAMQSSGPDQGTSVEAWPRTKPREVWLLSSSAVVLETLSPTFSRTSPTPLQARDTTCTAQTAPSDRLYTSRGLSASPCFARTLPRES